MYGMVDGLSGQRFYLSLCLNIPWTMTYLTEKEGTLGMNDIATISKERAEEYFVSFKSTCMEW